MSIKQPETCKEFFNYFNDICGKADSYKTCPIQKAFIGINNCADCYHKFDLDKSVSIGLLKLLYEQVEQEMKNED